MARSMSRKTAILVISFALLLVFGNVILWLKVLPESKFDSLTIFALALLFLLGTFLPISHLLNFPTIPVSVIHGALSIAVFPYALLVLGGPYTNFIAFLILSQAAFVGTLSLPADFRTIRDAPRPLRSNIFFVSLALFMSLSFLISMRYVTFPFPWESRARNQLASILSAREFGRSIPWPNNTFAYIYCSRAHDSEPKPFAEAWDDAEGLPFYIRGIFKTFKMGDNYNTLNTDPTKPDVASKGSILMLGLDAGVQLKVVQGYFLYELWTLYIPIGFRMLYYSETAENKLNNSFLSFGVVGGAGLQVTLTTNLGIFGEVNYGYTPVGGGLANSSSSTTTTTTKKYNSANVEGLQWFAGLVVRF
jgi:hypothetical protein